MRKIRRLGVGLLGVVLATYVASAASQTASRKATPKRYASVVEMADAMGDFPPETGEFKVVRRQPLHVRLSIERKVAGLPAPHVAEEFFRAFLWGIYRTFIHTDAQQVTVTVVSPVPVDGHSTMTATVTRAHALAVVQRLLGVRDWSDLITERQTWSEAMQRCRYSDHGSPGLRACALAVAGN